MCSKDCVNIDFSPEFVRLAVRGRHNKVSGLFDIRCLCVQYFQEFRDSDCFNFEVIDIDNPTGRCLNYVRGANRSHSLKCLKYIRGQIDHTP